MLPWMCGRHTLTIVVSSPCMTHAQMTVAVIAARLATGGAFSPLTAPAFAVTGAQSSAAAGVQVAGFGREAPRIQDTRRLQHDHLGLFIGSRAMLDTAGHDD